MWTLGRELFSKSLLNKILENSATKSHQDIITSITEATVRSIVMAVNSSQVRLLIYFWPVVYRNKIGCWVYYRPSIAGRSWKYVT